MAGFQSKKKKQKYKKIQQQTDPRMSEWVNKCMNDEVNDLKYQPYLVADLANIFYTWSLVVFFCLLPCVDVIYNLWTATITTINWI